MLKVAFFTNKQVLIHRASCWRQRDVLTPAPADRVECEVPRLGEDGRERRQAALKGTRRADPEERPHPEIEIECVGVHEQPLQNVSVATDMCAAESAGLVEMRTLHAVRRLDQSTTVVRDRAR